MPDHYEQPYQPIQCSAYDYVEIACLYRYRVELALKDGSCLTGIAISTKTIKNDGEYLILNKDSELLVRLDTILSITTLDENAEFQTATLNSGNSL